MNRIVTRRDYHLTRFRIEKYLEKGFDNLSDDELRDLRALSKDMSSYEQKHFAMPGNKVMSAPLTQKPANNS